MPTPIEAKSASITKLAIYPVKSAGRLDLYEAWIDKDGLSSPSDLRDHEYVVVRGKADEQGVHQFVTQRDKKNPDDRTERAQSFSDLAKAKPVDVNHGLQMRWEGAPSDGIQLPYSRHLRGDTLLQVWEHVGKGVEIPQGSEWLSDHLNTNVKLVQLGMDWGRMARQNYMSNRNPGRGWDGYPVHFINQVSVDELSSRAGQEVSVWDFRPQVVVDFGEPNIEHQIHEGKIGQVEFVCPKPCDRCPVTRVDAETGELKSFNPLTELAKYRQWVNQDGDPKVIMGENMLPLGSGRIRVGEMMTIEAYRNPPLVFGSRKEIMQQTNV